MLDAKVNTVDWVLRWQDDWTWTHIVVVHHPCVLWCEKYSRNTTAAGLRHVKDTHACDLIGTVLYFTLIPLSKR